MVEMVIDRPTMKDAREASARNKEANYKFLQCIEKLSEKGSKNLTIYAKEIGETNEQSHTGRIQR